MQHFSIKQQAQITYPKEEHELIKIDVNTVFCFVFYICIIFHFYDLFIFIWTHFIFNIPLHKVNVVHHLVVEFVMSNDQIKRMYKLLLHMETFGDF